ncbi:ribonuclease R family protein [Sphingopyxis terrae]|uniref:Ribonuclease R n=1 Tax=Sphingopyxis terrae subsp. ummariensis TaxID=429001 RepID=A0A1Y6E8B5_9SPHN|nr:VacB/RNase II family 3'-5' exoribonuclease [Sphingopyxis terrae]PCF92856.1 ribonuclease R [Sphingopyxis terrae subsp. ummariensis]SMQ58799.1 RNAse R [Sphingopyxis terrae subsp. ummariensis]
MKKPKPQPGLPSREQILRFIQDSPGAVGKREIAKHFALRGADKIALKALLKDMTDEGVVDMAPGRAFHKYGGLPKVTVLRVAAVEGDTVWAVPDRWEGGGPAPRLRVMEKGGKSALGVGDRILARTEERGTGHVAHPMKKLQSGGESVIGVLVADTGPGGKPMTWLRPADKRARFDFAVADMGDAAIGDLVRAELSGRGPATKARVIDRIGDPFAPRSLSMIAIAKHDIPHVFGDETLAEAERAATLPLTPEGREDLRDLPIVAIDPADARDHDDAVWAVPDEDPGNKGGWKAIVAIADVSYYVRPDGALDREARRRGNSVYFPDRVVPMLPETLSAGVCSLKAGQDRAAMACHLTVDKHGKLTSWRFTRALVRLRANIAYERAQAAYDADAPDEGWDADVLPALRHLWGCWTLLAKARTVRSPLDLDLPERQVILDAQGNIAEIRVRERLDAHRLIEDYMIAANVAAAKALEAKKSPVMYRIHEPPSREKLVSLKEYLESFEQSFALGQVITPAVFNRLIDGFSGDDRLPEIMEAILRSQTQAYYGPANAGHFGLALGSYAHFTSPIRRYADLLVHRALVDSYRLEVPGKPKGLPERSGLGEADQKGFSRIGEAISGLERRAMEAERETVDRYVAAYLAGKVGEIVPARITGVQPFGFFATVDGLGGDGLVPVSMLGSERFFYDEAARTLDSEHGRVSYSVGQRLDLRLMEANPVSGALRFELPDAPEGGFRNRPPRRDGVKKAGKHAVGKRGRPGNIRHQGKRR